MEFEEELYAERLRLKAQAAGFESGELGWSDEIPEDARKKISYVWSDVVEELDTHVKRKLEVAVERRTARSLAYPLSPQLLEFSLDRHPTVENYLSVMEAIHEELTAMATKYKKAVDRSAQHQADRVRFALIETFTSEINRIFRAYLVGFHLHANSRFVPVESQEMHNAVVAPTLYLLHSEPRFADAEKAYQKALKELRNCDPGDAITDAGSALSDLLKELGCGAAALGEQLKTARKIGLIRSGDAPLADAVVRWVAKQRNDGEAHTGADEFGMSDAWMVVHVVGALMIRLSEPAGTGGVS